MHSRPVLRMWNAGRCQFKRPPSNSPFTPASITVTEHGDLKELVDESLTFVDSNGDKWTAPKGTLTDGASVPRLFLPITDDRFDAEFLKAAVVHDAYCQEDNETRCTAQYRTKPWKAVHRMFYEACIAGGTSPLKAKLMFAGVWLGGPRWNDPNNPLEQASPDLLTKGYTGAKNWIVKTDPTIEEIEADIEKRANVLFILHELEIAILSALRDEDLTRANALLGEEEIVLEREFEKSPDDIMLLNFKGYWHKNRAIVYRSSASADKVEDELRDSAQAFNTVIECEPEEPGALNGLGSVSILRGDLDRAEQYIRKALSIAPTYEAAQHDLKLIEELRESQSPQ